MFQVLNQFESKTFLMHVKQTIINLYKKKDLQIIITEQKSPIDEISDIGQQKTWWLLKTSF